jgi:glycosyltransferase involved in cell wall biosynthesis
VAAVADAVIGLLRSPQMRQEMGRRGRERVRTRFDWRTMVAQLEEEYRAGLARAAAGRRWDGASPAGARD